MKAGDSITFDKLPDSALVRQSMLIGGATPVLPISPATLWRKVAKSTFPQPLRIGLRTTAWRVGDVRAWLAACETATISPQTVRLQAAQAQARISKKTALVAA
jgi:predicted DNA-binding transcriptional regulator AlpA